MLTYIISLENPISTLNQLRENGLDPILVEGVNGKKLPYKTMKENCTPFYSIFGPYGGIGCSMAHVKCWEKFLETDEKNVLILEDDVLLDEKFKTFFPKILENVPDDYDILYLGCTGCEEKPQILTKIKNIFSKTITINQYIKKPSISLGTHAYILSRKGAEKLLDNIKGKIYNQIDQMISQIADKKIINRYSSIPELAFQTSTLNSENSNLATNFPIILNKPLSKIKFNNTSIDYVLKCNFGRIGPFLINKFCLFFLFIGIILAYKKVSIKYIVIFYLLFSMIDIVKKNYNPVIFNFFLILLPSLIMYKRK